MEKNYGSSLPEVFMIPRLTIPSTTMEMLQALKDEYGGCISTKKVYKEHHLASYVWKVDYNPCINTLKRAKEYLLVPEKVHRVNMIVNVYPDLIRKNGKYSDAELDNLRDFKAKFYNR